MEHCQFLPYGYMWIDIILESFQNKSDFSFAILFYTI